MPRDLVPSREGPRREISTVVEPHNREWTAPKGGSNKSRGTPEELRAQELERAKRDLAVWTPATAVERMQQLPVGILEVYLLAEEVTQAREMILNAFPKPGNRARQRFLPPNDVPAAVEA